MMKAAPRHFHAEVSSGYSENTGLASEIFKLFKKWYWQLKLPNNLVGAEPCSRLLRRGHSSRSRRDWLVRKFRQCKLLDEAHGRKPPKRNGPYSRKQYATLNLYGRRDCVHCSCPVVLEGSRRVTET
jgi:hypothetical protein